MYICRTYDCALTALRVALAFAQDLVTAALVDGHGTLGAAVALLSKSPAGRQKKEEDSRKCEFESRRRFTEPSSLLTTRTPDILSRTTGA